MSQHSSLKIDLTKVRHRNVLKRHERIHRLQEQEKWNDRASAFGLPKVKSMKVKMKKIKEEKAPAGETPAGQAPGAPAAAAAPAAGDKKKAAASAPKAAEKKPAEKK